MKIIPIFLFLSLAVTVNSCSESTFKNDEFYDHKEKDSLAIKYEQPINIEPADIEIEKDFLYDQHTLTDTYPYKDTTRMFQWDKIRIRLALLESIQQEQNSWAILQNRNNINGEAPLAQNISRNAYKNVQDFFGIERYQSAPLYLLSDSITPKRYGDDGTLIRLITKDSGAFVKAEVVYFESEWLIPQKYIKRINDSVIFKKVIFVDRTNQNIATLEKVDSKWLIRSMNPATTGVYNPPHMRETPLGIFVIQEKKAKMFFFKDGSTATGGFAPYASRFSNGGYIHGVPVNSPGTRQIEFSSSLGTIPRSHMCVRNATSHAKFIYDWAPVEESLIFVFD